MSAFFIAINRDRSPFNKVVAEAMMTQLNRFGHDSKQLIVEANYAIGFQSHWTVPEEQGEQQPLYQQQEDCWLAFHGRIDNRPLLFELIQQADDQTISDAYLFLNLYRAFGESVFDKIVGPFAFVLFSPSQQKLIAARDSMGGRYLVHSITPEHILIATYEMALVAHQSIDYQFNQEKLVRLLTGIEDDVPLSPIAGLSPLFPGQQLNQDTHQQYSLPVFKTFYLPDPKRRIVLSSNREYADEFRRLLHQAVARRTRSIKPIGCMLSGGFDSVPIAISAASQLAKNKQQLQAYSWIFDDYPEADERVYSSQVCDDFGIRQFGINSDNAWPQLNEDTHQNPILPFSTPYSEFSQSLFKRAQQQGVGVMLSGIGGDMLYTGTGSIFYELLVAGQFKLFVAEFKTLWGASASKKQFVKHYLLLPVLESLLHKRFGKYLGNFLERRRIRKFCPPEYLTESAKQKLELEIGWLSSTKQDALRSIQYSNVVGSLEGEDCNYGRYMDAKYQLQRRYPFRDRDLVEFMLAIPSQQLFFNLQQRPIVRRAFAAEFPRQMKERKGKTDFSSVIAAGIRRDNNYGKWLESADGDWRRFVKQRYFKGQLASKHHIQRLKWRCGYYEFWKSVCYNPAKVNLGSGHENHEK